MALFEENFSFDRTRSPSLDSTDNMLSTRAPSRSVSPCSSLSPYPPPRFSVTDLAASFANSRLHADSQIYYQPCDSYANPDEDANWEIPPTDMDFPCAAARSRSVLPQRLDSPPTRTQRQSNTRLLCSSLSHAKDIAALVARMVDSHDQCTVSASEPCSPTTPIDDDEGYTSAELSSIHSEPRRSSVALAKSRLDYRRSSEFRTTGACVSKAVRLRKGAKSHKRIRSSESEA